ncbi:hypothetical protein ACLK19_17820 [Escherichia coli]
MLTKSACSKIIDTYAEATRHVDQGLSLTLFFPIPPPLGYQQSADLRLAQRYQNALLHSPRQMALEGTEIEGCVSCAL